MRGAIERWHDVARARDPASLDARLADDAVFLMRSAATSGSGTTSQPARAPLWRRPLRQARPRPFRGRARPLGEHAARLAEAAARVG